MAENIEQEIQKLEQELADRRMALEQRKEMGELKDIPKEKEVLREIIGEKLKPEEYPKPIEKMQPTEMPHTDIPSYEMPGIAEKVNKYLLVLKEKSLEEAIKQVRETKDPSLIDAFHDALVDDYFEQLVESGKIKEFKAAS